MTISSRTPEGEPHRCPICGNVAPLDPSYPGGDSCCPSCGQLLGRVRDCLSRQTGMAQEELLLSMPFTDLGTDSLDMVELVMELEEEFHITIPDDEAERIQTIEDVVRYLGRRRERERDQ